MPRGRPKGDQGADPRTNQMEAVRQAMAEDNLGMDAAPLEIQKFIQEKFGVDMDANMISSYKSSVRRKAGLKSKRRKKRGRQKAEAAASAAPAHHAASAARDSVTLKDLRAIKDVAERIGKKGLRDIVELLE